MPFNILVGLDGSPEAERVLPHLPVFSRPFEASVTLLTVLKDPASYMGDGNRDTAAGLLAGKHRQALRYLHTIDARIGRDATGIDHIAALGEPGMVISHFAASHRVNLIALATHPQTSIGRWVHPGVADRVIAQGHVPVLLVDGAGAFPVAPQQVSEIVVPLDGSAQAESALPFAQLLAAHMGASLRLVHPVEVQIAAVAGDNPTVASMEADQYTDALHATALDYVAQVQARPQAGGFTVTAEAPLGPAAELVAARATAPHCLVVLAGCRQSGLSALLRQSLRDRLLRSGVPTVVVPQHMQSGASLLSGQPQTASSGIPLHQQPAELTRAQGNDALASGGRIPVNQ